jgi:cob(I)alamin adenosyltransferase
LRERASDEGQSEETGGRCEAERLTLARALVRQAERYGVAGDAVDALRRHARSETK